MNEAKTRYACGIEYDGSEFLGFQKQKQTPTVQACLEDAFSSVANHPVEVVCAGRTDTGVSARGQVIHFDSASRRDLRAWLLGSNTRLPRSVSVLWVQPVDATFHARFSAVSRSYRYTILNRPVRPAIERRQVTWILAPLQHERMHAAAQLLLGHHDFNALRSSQCQAKKSLRTVHSVQVTRQGQRIHLDITADGFLHHMVRNIVGTLLPIGRGEKPVEWMQSVLESRDRRCAGVTAPPNGLVFTGVGYPAEYCLPAGEFNDCN